MIYEGSPADHLRGLATLAREKLRANRRCLYLNSPAMVAEMRSSLAAAGVDVAQEVEKRALILSSDQSHLVNDRFDVDRMLGMVADALNEALNDGYQGLWATGDMAWEFGNEKNFAKLLEYEHALEDLFTRQPGLSGVCHYHTETLPADVIQWGLYTHRAVYINEALSRPNPYYEPANLLTRRRQNVSGTQLETLLARSTRTEDLAVH
jgi:hypothetical protein